MSQIQVNPSVVEWLAERLAFHALAYIGAVALMLLLFGVLP